MQTFFLSRIEEIAGLKPDESERISDAIVVRKYSAGDFLLRAGQQADQLFFIENGLIRAFHFDKDKEINTYLGADGCYYTPLESFLSQKPSNENIQCLEDSFISVLHAEKLKALRASIPAIEKVLHVFLEQGYLCVNNRMKTFQMHTAKEKYLSFLDYADSKVIQCTPLLHIASYLGIAPESLSRVRKELQRSRKAV